VILRGGVSQMKGIPEAARLYFESDQVRLARFDMFGIQNPAYSTVVGLLHYVQRYQPRMYIQEKAKPGKKKGPGLWQRIKDWLTDIVD